MSDGAVIVAIVGVGVVLLAAWVWCWWRRPQRRRALDSINRAPVPGESAERKLMELWERIEEDRGAPSADNGVYRRPHRPLPSSSMADITVSELTEHAETAKAIEAPTPHAASSCAPSSAPYSWPWLLIAVAAALLLLAGCDGDGPVVGPWMPVSERVSIWTQYWLWRLTSWVGTGVCYYLTSDTYKIHAGIVTLALAGWYLIMSAAVAYTAAKYHARRWGWWLIVALLVTPVPALLLLLARPGAPRQRAPSQ